MALNGIKCSCKWLDEEACTSLVRHAPHRSGVRLIVEVGASSNRAYMGLGLDGPESLGLRQFGLGLGELGSDLSVLGLNLRFRIFRIHFEEVSGFLAFVTRIFSLSDFRCGPQTESVYSLSP